MILLAMILLALILAWCLVVGMLARTIWHS